MNSTLETVLETVAATVETIPPTAPVPPPPPPGPTPVIMVNDFQWLTYEFNKLADLDQIIIGFLLFFTLVIILRYTYKFFRIFF